MNPGDELKAFCGLRGAALAGVADLTPFRQGWVTLPADQLLPFNRAISVAVRLDDAAIETITGLPTTEYAENYRTVNALLDGLTIDIMDWMDTGLRRCRRRRSWT